MLQIKNRHLLTGEELEAEEIDQLLFLASEFKKGRTQGFGMDFLKGRHLALLFEKPSLRTRFSFTCAMHELGGFVVESSNQTRKNEEPEDIVRVLERYCHGIMIRTHDDEVLKRMANHSKIPIINGLTALHHPCQILSDLFTLQEKFGNLRGLKLAYVGACNNILHTLLLLAPQMGVEFHYCCEKKPPDEILKRASRHVLKRSGSFKSLSTPREAIFQSHAIYTDVWTSMGFEQSDENQFKGFQINENLMEHAKPKAVFMHCMPMLRGKEVSLTLPDHPRSIIFEQSENRLHMQKALLVAFMNKNTI